MGTMISMIFTGVYVYCCWKIALRFGRSGTWGFLLLIPLGNLLYWIIISATELDEIECETKNV
jgi:hypothetical protein